MNSKHLIFSYIALFIIGFTLMAAATRHGAGTTSDSVVHIDSANQIAQKGTYTTWFQKEGSVVPVTHFPPLYSGIVGLLAWMGLEAFLAARLLNCVFFGLNAVLVAALIHWYVPGSRFLPAAGGILMLFAPVMLDIHTMIGTEPMFIFFSLWGIIFLNHYFKKESIYYFFLSAACVSMAFLARYVGITLIGAIALTILLIDNKHFWKRLGLAILYGVIAIIPMLLFIIRNIIVAGNAANRRVEYHPFNMEHLWSMLVTYQSWLVPGSDRFNFIPAQEIILNLTVLVVIALAVALGLKKISQTLQQNGTAKLVEKLRQSPFIFVIFMAMYLILVGISISFFDKSTPMSDRILSPVFVSALILFMYMIGINLNAIGKNQKPVLIAATVYLLLFAGAGSVWILHSFKNGRGFNNLDWKYTKIAAAVDRLPENVKIYSNNPYIIYILNGRPAIHLPHLNDNYETNMKDFIQNLRQNGGIIAFFDTHPKNPAKHSPRRVWEYFDRQMDEIRASCFLSILEQEKEGILYMIHHTHKEVK